MLSKCRVNQSFLSCLWLLGLLAAVAGCTTSVVVEGRVPTPLVNQIPAKVAIYYDEHFRSYVHTESLKGEGNWKVDLGEQNLSFFRSLMSAMFKTVVEVPSPELDATQMLEYDALIVPSIDKYGFLTPGISGLGFFSASLNYKVRITDVEGNEIVDYRVVGYGKSEAGLFSSGKALMEATMSAIRDGGTRIATELKKEERFAEWSNQLEGD